MDDKKAKKDSKDVKAKKTVKTAKVVKENKEKLLKKEDNNKTIKKEKLMKKESDDKAMDKKDLDKKDKIEKDDKKVDTKKTDVKKVDFTEKKFDKVEVKGNSKDIKSNLKNEDSKVKIKSKNKKGKVLKVILVILLIVLIGSLLTFLIVNSSSPKKTVDGFFTNIREGDFETAKVFIVTSDQDFNNSFDQEILDLLFDKLTWKVNDIEVNGDNCVVNIDITNKNFKVVTDNYMKRVSEAAKAFITGKQFTQSDFHRFFIEELKNDKVETITSNKTLNLVKSDNQWKLLGDDKLIDALVSDLINSLVTPNN